MPMNLYSKELNKAGYYILLLVAVCATVGAGAIVYAAVRLMLCFL